MALNRYEEILTRLVAAQVANDHVPEIAAQSAQLRKAAALLESHFQAREQEQAIAQRSGRPI